MKHLIKKFFNKFGYDISKLNVNDINLYLELYDHKSISNKQFYNIGAGTFSHPAWTNIDHNSEWYKENSTSINHDLLDLSPLPIKTNSAEIVYSSHTIEHIPNEAAQNMFNESFRILKPNGTLRITAPNIDLDYRAYKNNDKHYFYWKENYSLPNEVKRVKLKKPMNEGTISEIFLYHFATGISPLYSNNSLTDEQLKIIFSKMEYESALNFITSKCPISIQKINPGHHINWWNKNKLIKMLKIAGFTNTYLSGYGQSFSPVLRNTTYFDNTYPKVSIYAEAIK